MQVDDIRMKFSRQIGHYLFTLSRLFGFLQFLPLDLPDYFLVRSLHFALIHEPRSILTHFWRAGAVDPAENPLSPA